MWYFTQKLDLLLNILWMISAYKFTIRNKNEMDGLRVEINWNTADVRYLEFWLFQTYAIPNKIPRVPRVCLKVL